MSITAEHTGGRIGIRVEERGFPVESLLPEQIAVIKTMAGGVMLNYDIAQKLGWEKDEVGVVVRDLYQRYGGIRASSGRDQHAGFRIVISAVDQGDVPLEELVPPESSTAVKLTTHQRKILELMVADGGIRRDGTIADELETSLASVREITRKIFSKLGAHSRVEAALKYMYARQLEATETAA